MNKVTITRNGQTVDCFGVWQENSNCIIQGDWKDGTELEEVYADGGQNWTEVVEKITTWAQQRGATIYELQEC